MGHASSRTPAPTIPLPKEEHGFLTHLPGPKHCASGRAHQSQVRVFVGKAPLYPIQPGWP